MPSKTVPTPEMTAFPFFIQASGEEPSFVQFQRIDGDSMFPPETPSLSGDVGQTNRLCWQVTITKLNGVPSGMCVYYIGECGQSDTPTFLRVIETPMNVKPPPLPPAPEGCKDMIVELAEGLRVALILREVPATRDDYRTFVIGDDWNGKLSLYSVQEFPVEPQSGPIDS